MEFYIEAASVQYNDMNGSSALDWHGGSELHDMARGLGIDPDRYFPIGLELWGIPPQLSYIYAVEKSEVLQSYDNIQAYAREHNGEVPVTKFAIHKDVGFEALAKYVKRYNSVLTTKMPGAHRYKIESELSIE